MDCNVCIGGTCNKPMRIEQYLKPVQVETPTQQQHPDTDIDGEMIQYFRLGPEFRERENREQTREDIGQQQDGNRDKDNGDKGALQYIPERQAERLEGDSRPEEQLGFAKVDAAENSERYIKPGHDAYGKQ